MTDAVDPLATDAPATTRTYVCYCCGSIVTIHITVMLYGDPAVAFVSQTVAQYRIC